MEELIGAIYNSDGSVWLRSETWAIPAIQTVHLLALAVLFGSAVMLDMKLAGVVARGDTATVLVRRYLPPLWVALAVLLVSGASLIWAEPERVLPKQVFWIKMALVLAAVGLTFLLRKRLLQRAEAGAVGGPVDAAFGWIVLIIWVAALVCGRWIAYAY